MDIITAIAVVLGKMIYSDESISFAVHFIRQNNNKPTDKPIDKTCYILVKKPWLNKFFSDFKEKIYKQLNDVFQLSKDINYHYKITDSKALEMGCVFIR